MVKTSFAHKPKLRAYIESRGQRLPMSVSKYIRPGDKDTMCLFCNALLDEDAEYEVQLYRGGIEGAEATGAYMCGVCFGPVKEMETKLAGQTGLGSLFDTYGMGDRLELFAKELNFQTDVHKHYQHLNLLFEVKPIEAEMCYFCKNKSKHDYFMLEVPTSGAEYLDGGKIRCCFNCRDMLLDLIVEKNFARFFENKGIIRVECPVCESEYPIYPGEWEYRIQTESIHEHLCPECTMHHMSSWQTIISPALQYIYTPVSKGFLVNRWRIVYCAYCTTPIDIDVTLPERLVAAKNISWKGLVMCSPCAHGTAGPIHGFAYQGRVWTVYKTTEKDAYKIVVRSLHSERRLLEKTVKGDITDIILGSYSNIIPFIDQQTQIKM